LKAFTSFAPGEVWDITAEEGRLPNSSGETPYAFATSITIVSGEAAASSSFVKWIGQRLGAISSGQFIASNISTSGCQIEFEDVEEDVRLTRKEDSPP
jgi:hypothetical protein